MGKKAGNKGKLTALKGGKAKSTESQAQIQERMLRRKLMELEARYDVGTGNFTIKGVNYTPAQVADMTWLGKQGWSAKAFRTQLENICQELYAAELARAKGRVLDWSEGLDARAIQEVEDFAGVELDRFVRLLEHPDTTPDRHDYYVAAWRQLIWQVKRKLRGEKTSWEIMLCLYSKQGTGKSSAVAKFAKPLGDLLYMPQADFHLFTDRSRFQLLNKKYLICFDEMTGGSKVEIDKIKQAITADLWQGRVMYSMNELSLTRNANFIGTTNRPLIKILRDTTGMRRFVEMRCRDEAYNDLFGKALNEINFARIWQCESGEHETESPAFKLRDAFSKFQQELRSLTDIEKFIENYLERTDDVADKIKNTEMHSIYKEFCQQNNRPSIAQRLLPGEMNKHLSWVKCHKAHFYTHVKWQGEEQDET